MKKILRSGTRNLPAKWIGNCPSCGCQFEYDRSDLVYSDTFKQMPLYVECPECHQPLRHSDQTRCSMDKVSTIQA